MSIAWKRISGAPLRIAGLAAALLAPIGGAVAADTCWNHNGSLMRLQSDGARRMFVYEVPREGLRAIGVRPGTLLFDGRRVGTGYEGTARFFLRGCDGEAIGYPVRGVVSADQTTVTMTGTRNVYNGCAARPERTEDVLVFTYVRQCDSAPEPPDMREVPGDPPAPPVMPPPGPGGPGPRRAN